MSFKSMGKCLEGGWLRIKERVSKKARRRQHSHQGQLHPVHGSKLFHSQDHDRVARPRPLPHRRHSPTEHDAECGSQKYDLVPLADDRQTAWTSWMTLEEGTQEDS